MRDPLPPMTLAKSVPCVTVSVRLKASVALLVIALAVESEPLVAPFQIWSVPAFIVVVPV